MMAAGRQRRPRRSWEPRWPPWSWNRRANTSAACWIRPPRPPQRHPRPPPPPRPFAARPPSPTQEERKRT
eukprot:15125408-Alexandrium_andersonii.AAC.1